MQPPKVENCSLHYASALADPEFTPSGACVPTGFPVPSQKCKTFVRGTMQLGTSGIGFVIAQALLANDLPGVAFSTSASTGIGTTPLSGFGGLQFASVPHLPFTTAQLASITNTLKGRFVAGILKIRYSGTEANRNGTVTTIEEPTHADLSAQSRNGIIQFISSYNERPPPDGAWHSVAWSGLTSPTDYSWVTTPSQEAATYPLGAIVQGVAGDAYDWEMFIHTEYSGNIVQAASASHADELGFGKIVSAMKNVTNARPLSESTAPLGFSGFLQSVGTTVKSIANIAETVSDFVSPKLLAKGGFGLLSPIFARSSRGMLGM